jgi:hypothetical protein
MVQILQQYAEGEAAVTHALSLVLAYISFTEHEDKRSLAEKHTPAVLGRGGAPRQKRDAIVVFDIDDTLLFDVSNSKSKKGVIPHQIVVDLLLRLRQIGAYVHLVTARLQDAEYEKETREELSSLGIHINAHYSSLTLAPEKARTSMAAVSKWKMDMRRKIAITSKTPVTLTVGDQWGDMVVLEDDDDIDSLDEEHNANSLPFIVLRPHDKVSLWGLKLPAYQD